MSTTRTTRRSSSSTGASSVGTLTNAPYVPSTAIRPDRRGRCARCWRTRWSVRPRRCEGRPTATNTTPPSSVLCAAPTCGTLADRAANLSYGKDHAPVQPVCVRCSSAAGAPVPRFSAEHTGPLEGAETPLTSSPSLGCRGLRPKSGRAALSRVLFVVVAA